MIMAVPTEIEVDSPKNWSKPDIVASEMPKPPGIILTAPTSEEKLKTKVEKVILIL